MIYEQYPPGRPFPFDLSVEQIREMNHLEWNHTLRFNNISTPGKWDQNHQSWIEQFIPSMEGKDVLDIGFHDGYYSFRAEYDGANRIIGIDHVFRDTAKFVHSVMRSRVKLMERDMFEFDPRREFDIVLFLGVYYHVDELLRSIRIVHDLLNEDGTAMIEGPVYLGRLNRILKLPQIIHLADPPTMPNYHLWRPTLSALKAILDYVGFTRIHVHPWFGSRCLIEASKS